MNKANKLISEIKKLNNEELKELTKRITIKESSIVKETSFKYKDKDGNYFEIPSSLISDNDEILEDSIMVKKTKDGYVLGFAKYTDVSESPNDMNDGVFLVFYNSGNFWVTSGNVSQEELEDYFETPEEERDSKLPEYYVFPVSAYIHSGVALHFGFSGSGWDISNAGAILCEKSTFTNKQEAENYAKGFLNEWQAYEDGEVFQIYALEYTNDRKFIPGTDGVAGDTYGTKWAIEEVKNVLENYN